MFNKRLLCVLVAGGFSLACLERSPTEARLTSQMEDGSVASAAPRQVVAASGRHTSTASNRRAASAAPQGNWGGPSVNLTVTLTGGTIEFDCGRGTIDAPMLLDLGGRFDVPGTFIREGGPERENPDRLPARYTGWTDGKTMILSVATGDSQIVDLPLTIGTQTRLMKCL